MKIFRISNFLALGIATVLGFLLFWTSQAVQQREDTLSDIRSNLAHEYESVRVLGVEWDYLNRPQRLEKLAAEQLGMELPATTELVRNVNEIPEPIIVNTNPDFYGEEGGAQNVSLETPKPKVAAPAPIAVNAAPKKEIVSPAKAEKQTFYDLMNDLKKRGGE